MAYPSESKNKLGLSAVLSRIKGSTFELSAKWFEAQTEPPAHFGRFSDLVNCLTGSFGEREVSVQAIFSYDPDKADSLFRPISVTDQASLFDEIVGFQGVKRDATGKTLYEMEVSLGTKRLVHTVRFAQTVRLSEDLVLPLIETASKISTLALRPKGAR
jgi:hypothetical protein